MPTGLPAWKRAQPGQVGNQAALSVATSAGGKARHPYQSNRWHPLGFLGPAQELERHFAVQAEIVSQPDGGLRAPTQFPQQLKPGQRTPAWQHRAQDGVPRPLAALANAAWRSALAAGALTSPASWSSRSSGAGMVWAIGVAGGLVPP